MSRLLHFYKGTVTEHDGIKFASKLEAAYYQHLKTLHAAGEVLTFLRQVPFHLPGGVRYVCDFLVFYRDGGCAFVDVKSVITREFNAKRKMVEQLYAPITIEIVKKVPK